MKMIMACACILLMATGCANNENAQLIVGNWNAVEWKVDGQPDGHNTADTHFSFDAKGNYNYQYGELKEAGTYKVENNMLFTRKPKETEMMVKIVKLTADSLVFDMSRSGQQETLTLLRAK